MTPTNYWFWTYFDPVRKKRIRTRHRLTEAGAAESLPAGAEKVPGSLEVRLLPDPGEALAATSAAHLYDGFKAPADGAGEAVPVQPPEGQPDSGS